MSTPFPERWSVGDEHNQIVGADLASAATIVPTHSVHHITGTAAIVNITPPWDTFSGRITLIADGAWTMTAAGNISILAAAATPLRAYSFVYSPSRQKWYPD